MKKNYYHFVIRILFFFFLNIFLTHSAKTYENPSFLYKITKVKTSEQSKKQSNEYFQMPSITIIPADQKNLGDDMASYYQLRSGIFLPSFYTGANNKYIFKQFKEQYKAAFPYIFPKNVIVKKVNLPVQLYARSVANKAYVTIFKMPGLTWKDCKESNNPCIAWPPVGSELNLLDARLVKTYVPETEDTVWQIFYLVSYNFTIAAPKSGTDGKISANGAQKEHSKITRTGQGWISSEFTVVKSVKIKKPTFDKTSVKDTKEYQSMEQKIANIKKDLSPHMGACLLDFDMSYEKATEHKTFEDSIIQYWKNKDEFFEITKPYETGDDGFDNKIIRSDMVAIDTLARTIYGEIASTCEKYGVEYLMAVANVIKNRVDFIKIVSPKEASIFSSQKASVLNDALINSWTNVLTYNKRQIFQFSVWQPKMKKRQGKTIISFQNPSIPQVLCPPRDMNEIYYVGKKPYNELSVSIWNRSLDIALMAILLPKEFGDIVKNSEVLYYTNPYITHFHNYYPYWGRIANKLLDHPACIKFWSKTKHIDEDEGDDG